MQKANFDLAVSQNGQPGGSQKETTYKKEAHDYTEHLNQGVENDQSDLVSTIRKTNIVMGNDKPSNQYQS